MLKQIPLAAALLIVALLVEVTVLARLHLPGSVPDLVLLVVVGLALVHGPRHGSIVGFVGGLLSDLAPPADHAAGREALALTVIGYAVGLIRREAGQLRSALGAIVVVACASVVSVWVYAGIGLVVGDHGSQNLPLAELTVTAVIYNVLLAPFVVPGVMALARRTVSDPVALTLGGTTADSGPAKRGSGKGGVPGLSMPRVRSPRGRPLESVRTGRTTRVKVGRKSGLPGLKGEGKR